MGVRRCERLVELVSQGCRFLSGCKRTDTFRAADGFLCPIEVTRLYSLRLRTVSVGKLKLFMLFIYQNWRCCQVYAGMDPNAKETNEQASKGGEKNKLITKVQNPSNTRGGNKKREGRRIKHEIAHQKPKPRLFYFQRCVVGKDRFSFYCFWNNNCISVVIFKWVTFASKND